MKWEQLSMTIVNPIATGDDIVEDVCCHDDSGALPVDVDDVAIVYITWRHTLIGQLCALG